MLRDSEVQGMRNDAYRTLMECTDLSDIQAEEVLTKISEGKFTEAFAEIHSNCARWRVFDNRRVHKAIRRLLVPEYMKGLIPLRRLAGLLDAGYCLQRQYRPRHSAGDLMLVMNDLLDGGKINHELWHRFLLHIGRYTQPCVHPSL